MIRLTFRVDSSPDRFAGAVETLATHKTFQWPGDEPDKITQVDLQRAQRKGNCHCPSSVSIHGILSHITGDEHVEYFPGREYIVFSLTALKGDRTRVEAKCLASVEQIELYFFRLLLLLGEDFPEIKPALVEFLQKAGVMPQLAAKGAPAPQLETQEAIYEAAQMRADAILENKPIPKLQTVLEHCTHRITDKQFKKHAPDLARNWKNKDYRVVVRYDEDTRRWVSSEF